MFRRRVGTNSAAAASLQSESRLCMNTLVSGYGLLILKESKIRDKKIDIRN